MPPGCKSNCTVQGFCQKNIQRNTCVDQTHFFALCVSRLLVSLGIQMRFYVSVCFCMIHRMCRTQHGLVLLDRHESRNDMLLVLKSIIDCQRLTCLDVRSSSRDITVSAIASTQL
jgi:hypothetical protein